MKIEATTIIGLSVYTNSAVSVGEVTDLILDFNTNSIYGLYIQETNPELVDGGVPVSVPYRLIKALYNIIILKAFPEHIKVKLEEIQ
ncbi:MAG: PRC-barrel domain-containing protein [Candidatus Thermoplasmatota archaeon]|nr:PRC-barrel domain-containing protein [Candidatus Thermoplasmatota archaeon]MCL5730664.1 PRC-barrel domain-containing protein [Candidatus Thermoplasmatota archaeon]